MRRLVNPEMEKALRREQGDSGLIQALMQGPWRGDRLLTAYIAEEKRLRNKTGNATFRTDLIDAVFNLTEQTLKERIRYEVYQG